MRKVKIGTKLVGEGEPVFIIAEAGINHNGDIKRAKRMIEVAAEAKADAVKFQTFSTDKLLSKKAVPQAQYKMAERLKLTKGEHQELMKYASRKAGILFLSTPFDEDSADLLERLGVVTFKIGSGDVDNLPLLRHIAKKGLPIILSTGMSTMGEVREAVKVLKDEKNQDLILLHCTSCYPAEVGDVNLRAMQTLRKTFGVPVGYSDHTRDIEIALAAVAMGACVIEKHFTLNRNLPGPDHKASLEPNELNQMIKNIRDIEKALGDGIKKPTKSELETKKLARRSIVAKVSIPKGVIITPDMLAIKRPGTGLRPKDLKRVVGKRANFDIREDELITIDKICIPTKKGPPL